MTGNIHYDNDEENRKIFVKEGTPFPENLRTVLLYVWRDMSFVNHEDLMIVAKSFGELTELLETIESLKQRYVYNNDEEFMP